jgi:hypothetical protein
MKYKSMFEVFVASTKCFPLMNTKGFKLLELFAQKKRIYREELVGLLGDDFRTEIQALDGSNYHWLIHRGKEGNRVVYIELDGRHYSMNIDLDNEARKERRKQLTDQSYKEAKLGRVREPIALAKRTDAWRETVLSFGEAANDSSIKNKTAKRD